MVMEIFAEIQRCLNGHLHTTSGLSDASTRELTGLHSDGGRVSSAVRIDSRDGERVAGAGLQAGEQGAPHIGLQLHLLQRHGGGRERDRQTGTLNYTRALQGQ